METPKSVHIAKAIENNRSSLDSPLIVESRNLCELITSYSKPVADI